MALSQAGEELRTRSKNRLEADVYCTLPEFCTQTTPLTLEVLITCLTMVLHSHRCNHDAFWVWPRWSA